ncbi:MAG TPA: FAD-dependent oxidoreductase [Actinomycetota bacterium]|nr:FAD-dependent oxidoreductase [Actinomycetota bacterium]
MDPNHEILFEPVRIGPKTLRNRFYQVPHCSGFGTEKPWTQAAHRGVKAEGGWAVVCTEYAPFSPDSDEAPLIAARFWDEDDMRALRLMTDAAHEHGALAGLELHHSGAHAPNSQTRLPSIAPSQLASDLEPHVVPKEMERTDIRRVVNGWADAAVRARDCGFDIVYVYGAHSYLPMQFLSPFYNKRTDGYGGAVKDRARFWLETLEGVREAVGADCAVVTRIAVDALGPAGIHLEEALEFVNFADDLVDLWDVNVGSIASWSKDSGTSRYFDEGNQLEWTGGIHEATAKPIVGVGRLTSPDRMASIVRSGAWDLVGAARPSIADPFLPQKILEGRTDEIRECTGSNVCIMKVDGFGHLGCIQNATAGDEHRRDWHPERFERASNAGKGVLVVGAGPAGMECAVTLGRRGFEAVHLVETSEDVGGRMRWVRRLPTLGDWGRIVDHRKVMLSKLRNVEVVTGRRLSAEDVRDYGAQLVVVATGSRWSGEGLQSSTHEPIWGASPSLPHVLTPEQVMDGKRPPGRRVVVYDAEGYFVGPGIAELLANEGLETHLVTSLDVVSPISDLTLEGPMLRQHLHELGVMAHRGVTVLAVEPGLVSGEDEFEEPWSLETDGIVLVTQQLSDDLLYRELLDDPAALELAGIEAVYRIGDCVAPRMISEAIFDGHRLAREIDGADPAVALSFDRERNVPDVQPAAR